MPHACLIEANRPPQPLYIITCRGCNITRWPGQAPDDSKLQIQCNACAEYYEIGATPGYAFIFNYRQKIVTVRRGIVEICPNCINSHLPGTIMSLRATFAREHSDQP